ncbi:MAG: ribosomal-processing cysteine protease Prp [Bacilli bacterium]|nr:ribosomal-processing cysteine protease Prp [Bacilli bacterium]
MILVTREGSKIQVTGHALYDSYGKDIVCSAVSSIIITTINGIISIDPNAISYKQNKDGIILEIKKNDNVTSKLIDNMIELLTKLSNDYPKNIQIKEGV